MSSFLQDYKMEFRSQLREEKLLGTVYEMTFSMGVIKADTN